MDTKNTILVLFVVTVSTGLFSGCSEKDPNPKLDHEYIYVDKWHRYDGQRCIVVRKWHNGDVHIRFENGQEKIVVPARKLHDPKYFVKVPNTIETTKNRSLSCIIPLF